MICKEECRKADVHDDTLSTSSSSDLDSDFQMVNHTDLSVNSVEDLVSFNSMISFARFMFKRPVQCKFKIYFIPLSRLLELIEPFYISLQGLILPLSYRMLVFHFFCRWLDLIGVLTRMTFTFL